MSSRRRGDTEIPVSGARCRRCIAMADPLVKNVFALGIKAGGDAPVEEMIAAADVAWECDANSRVLAHRSVPWGRPTWYTDDFLRGYDRAYVDGANGFDPETSDEWAGWLAYHIANDDTE